MYVKYQRCMVLCTYILWSCDYYEYLTLTVYIMMWEVWLMIISYEFMYITQTNNLKLASQHSAPSTIARVETEKTFI